MEQERQKREVDENGSQSMNASILCANNCGFFGTAATNNLCSKCYREFFLKQSKSTTVTGVAEKKSDELITETKVKKITEDEGTKGTPDGEGATSQEPEKRSSNRCSFCKKRVGLTGFKCRCEQTFCSLHRYSDKHNCLFDYKSAGQDEISKANPVIKAEKMEKI